MDLIRCIYTEQLVARTCPQLLRTLELADKFEIPSLLIIIAGKIQRTAKTLQHHLSILGLPERIQNLQSMVPVVECVSIWGRLCVYSTYNTYSTHIAHTHNTHT